MKNIIVIFVLLLSFFKLSFAQNNTEVLTNQKIIQLSKIGLKPSVIISKINSSQNNFDVSTDALINLSENSVDADVISEMMKYNNNQQATANAQKDMNDPRSMHRPGIYYYDANDANNQIKIIDPSVCGNSHSGEGGIGYVSAAASSSSISGAISQTQFNDASPIIYFYFDKTNNPQANNWFFATASSPKEFVLVKFDMSKNARSFKTGGAVGVGGFGGSNIGIPEKIKIPFTYSEIADGIYKVTFIQPLPKGEYGFIYASSAPSMFSNDKVFDFGIQNGQ